MPSTWKCTLCEQGKRYTKDDLIDHIDQEHRDAIPEGWSAGRVAFKMIHNKSEGTCVVCKGPTEWNEKRCKYQRLCKNPECRKKLRELALKNHIRVYGKPTLLTDMEHQEKMLKGRHISGEYLFPDGYKIGYVGSFEKNFLEFMDQVLHCKGQDIQEPGPVLDYIYKGSKHQWITDFYYIPYNLVIEIKDGGNNPNKKAMPDSRERQIYKEKMITDLGTMNYLRLTNNNFSQLLEIFAELKMQMIDDSNENRKVIIRINEEAVLSESPDITVIKKIEEWGGSLISKYKDRPDFKKFLATLGSYCKDAAMISGDIISTYVYIRYVSVPEKLLNLILTSLEIPPTLIAAGVKYIIDKVKHKKPKENILPFKTDHISKDCEMFGWNSHYVSMLMGLPMTMLVGQAKKRIIRNNISYFDNNYFNDFWKLYINTYLSIVADQWYALDFFVSKRDPNLTKLPKECQEMSLNTDIVACNDGIVLITSNMKIRDNEILKNFLLQYTGAIGNHVVIMHDPGSYSLYAHLQTDTIKVKPGQIVKQGEVIAKMGNTGNSSGPHLHFQMSYLIPKGPIQGMWFGRPLTNFKFTASVPSIRNITNMKKFEDDIMTCKPKQYRHAALPWIGWFQSDLK